MIGQKQFPQNIYVYYSSTNYLSNAANNICLDDTGEY